MCDFSGLPKGNYNGFIRQILWGKSHSQTADRAQPRYYSLQFCVKDSGTLASHALSPIYIPRPGALILTSLAA